MPVLAPERVEEIVAGWRLGVDEKTLESPAGPLFDVAGFAEYDITMTGGGGGSLNTFEIISCALPAEYHGQCACN
jgi:hypothetical protein